MKQLEAFKALSNDQRLQILTWLKEPSRHFPTASEPEVESLGICVSDIQQKSGLSQSTVSHYLSILHKAGLVSATRVGQWTYYKRNEQNIEQLVNFIQTAL
ncbi:MAG: metalloregulator ArsR/SmtB family transcription factor [Crocosphaera sp.]|nr:metalloregulator ArsR/SmtB family transcription factor [Crocosphaera sp.]